MTREQVKQVAIELVGTIGLVNLSRSGLCERAGIPDGSFPHLMGCTFFDFVTELRTEGVASPFRPVEKTRTRPELRKEHILDTAVAVASEVGYQKLTREKIAEAAGVSTSLITTYFDNMTLLKQEVLGQAVRHENLVIIAQGLANNDPIALVASPELKSKAASILLGV